MEELDTLLQNVLTLNKTIVIREKSQRSSKRVKRETKIKFFTQWKIVKMKIQVEMKKHKFYSWELILKLGMVNQMRKV